MKTLHRVMQPDPGRPFLDTYVGKIVELDTPKKSGEGPLEDPQVREIAHWYPRCVGWAYMLPSLDLVGRVWLVTIGDVQRYVVLPFAVQSVSPLYQPSPSLCLSISLLVLMSRCCAAAMALCIRTPQLLPEKYR